MIMWILVVLGVTRDLESGEIKVFSLLAKHTSNVSPRWQESMKDECLHRSIKTIMGLFYLELSSKGLVRQEEWRRVRPTRSTAPIGSFPILVLSSPTE